MVVKTRGMGKERIGESFHENIFLVEESRVACEVYRSVTPSEVLSKCSIEIFC